MKNTFQWIIVVNNIFFKKWRRNRLSRLNIRFSQFRAWKRIFARIHYMYEVAQHYNAKKEKKKTRFDRCLPANRPWFSGSKVGHADHR